MKRHLSLLAAFAALTASLEAGSILSDDFNYPNGAIVGASGSPWVANTGNTGTAIVTNNQLYVAGSGSGATAISEDIAALLAIHEAVPEARFRIDANAGFSAEAAIRLIRAIEANRLVVECYEQPCGQDELDAMALVTAALDVPIIADESVKRLEDLDKVIAAKAADGVNLKLVKSGGPLGCLAIGRRAKERGMPLMIGGMVETRLGMTAGAHVAAALGGVEFVDLDTAWLLAADPYDGRGYQATGPKYVLPDEPGLGIFEAKG